MWNSNIRIWIKTFVELRHLLLDNLVELEVLVLDCGVSRNLFPELLVVLPYLGLDYLAGFD